MLQIKTLIIAAVVSLSATAMALAPAQAFALRPVESTSQKKCVETLVQSGSKGICVQNLQFMLNMSNKAGLATDGSFGLKTKTAVKNWQTARRISIDGKVGPQTWGTLCSSNPSRDHADAAYSKLKTDIGCAYLVPKKVTPKSTPFICVKHEFGTKVNSNNICVEYIQNMLNIANGAKLQRDGDFGPKTYAAVKAWQTKQSPKIQVDGIVGVQTWGTLCANKNDKIKDPNLLAAYILTAHNAGCY